MHSYSAAVAWSGSTGVGYDGYDRRHAGVSKAGFVLPLSSDAAFLGDPVCLNPEELLVLAAASCQLLSFLAVAARARIDVIDYRDEAAGQMPDDALTQITLRPHIVVAAGIGAGPLMRPVCFIFARSPTASATSRTACVRRFPSNPPLRFVRIPRSG